MDSIEYKLICSSKRAFRVSDLQKTVGILRKEGAKEVSVVASAMLKGIVEQPKNYSGYRRDKYCLVICSFEEASAIVDLLFEAEACSVPASGVPTAITLQIADLVDKWSELRDSL